MPEYINRRIIHKLEREEWHQALVRSAEQHKFPYAVECNGIELVLFPTVFNPNYGKASLFFLDHLGVRKGDRVLDMFTGSGIDAIVAAQKGARDIVAVDKYTLPYLCARYNVHQLELDKKIAVRQGDLWSPMGFDTDFDLILANPPFYDRRQRVKSQSALCDKDNHLLKTFFGGAKYHLFSVDFVD